MHRIAPMPRTTPTLVDVLRRDAADGDIELYRFCPSPEATPQVWTRGDLDSAARAWAHYISEHTAPDARVLVLASFGKSFPLGFLACLYAGRTAVPALCPSAALSAHSIARLRHIVSDVAPDIVLSERTLSEDVLSRVPELARCRRVAFDAVPSARIDPRADLWRRPEGLRRRPAFIQYTSGSTRVPRGVIVTHENLIEHQARAHEVFASPPGSTTVSWLPFHHDMGLIGAMLYPLYCGGRGVFLPPPSFLRRPMWWLEMISATHARTSTAPNFAYDVCTQRATDEQVSALDLSGWKISVCGAEPVRPSTMRRFCERFAAAGFRPETFLPCFGLAEATLVGTASEVEVRPTPRRFDKHALRGGELRDPVDGLPVETHVACGRPMRGHELSIVDPATRRALPERRVGEIWMRGPSVAGAYWRSGDAAEPEPERFSARLSAHDSSSQHEGTDGSDGTGDPWMRTGDVGALVDGELFVFGRVDDFIEIVDGERRSWWDPAVIEFPIDQQRPRGVSGAAVAYRGHAGLTVAVETRRLADTGQADAIVESIRNTVREATGLELDRVLLLPPRSVAKTSSGKLRRYRYRLADARNELEARHDWRGASSAQGDAA